MNNKPLKRAKELRPLSIDHHHGLLLCWKIRTGLTKNIATDRIWKYVEWFFREHLEPHFELEEKYVFPLLDNPSMIDRALGDHAEIRRAIEVRRQGVTLEQFADMLQAHIRFEERILFVELQKTVNEQQFNIIEKMHHLRFKENNADPFWEK